MNIVQVAASAAGNLQPAERAWDILSPVGEPPLRVYQQKLWLRFPPDMAADRIAIDAAATVLQGQFAAFDYNAHRDDIPHLQATFRSGPSESDGVIVELDAPRDIVRIGFGFHTLSTPAVRVGIHRLDGDQLSQQPTVDVPLGSLTSIGTIAIGGNQGFLSAAAGPGVFAGPARHSLSSAVTISDFTDARFAIVLRDAADLTRTVPLAVTQVTSLTVRSRPAAPRFGLPDPRQPEQVLFFRPTPDEVKQSVGADQIDVQAGAAFAAQLQRYLDDSNSVPGEPIEVPLIVESDAPCRLDISSFNVGFQFAIESFADKSLHKQVLQFSGQQAVAQQINLRLPADADVTEASMRTVESFRADRLVNGVATDAASAPPSNRGVYFAVGRSVAQQFEPNSAVSVSGVALFLVALAETTQITIELQSDAADRPSGQVLAEGSAELVQAGRPTWTTVAFSEPVVVSSESHWLVVSPAAGRGMWVADDTDSNRLAGTGADGTWTELTGLTGLHAKQTLLSRMASLNATRPFALSSDGIDVSPLETHPSDPPDTRVFELSPALSQRLAQSANDDSVVDIRLTATSTVTGTLTVYRPLIKYDRTSYDG